MVVPVIVVSAMIAVTTIAMIIRAAVRSVRRTVTVVIPTHGISRRAISRGTTSVATIIPRANRGRHHRASNGTIVVSVIIRHAGIE